MANTGRRGASRTKERSTAEVGRSQGRVSLSAGMLDPRARHRPPGGTADRQIAERLATLETLAEDLEARITALEQEP